jgi:hypothetical protein
MYRTGKTRAYCDVVCYNKSRIEYYSNSKLHIASKLHRRKEPHCNIPNYFNMFDPLHLVVTASKINRGSCCDILKSHHDLLKYDSERLSTDFIKKLSRCSCRTDMDD